MADPAPIPGTIAKPDPDDDGLARRVAQLEAALARRAVEIDDLQAALDVVTDSAPYRVGRFLAKVYDRWLPVYTRRRWAAGVVCDLGRRLVRRLTGKDLAR